MGKFRKVFTDPKLLVVLLLGFSSGLPYLLVGGTLKAWLARSGMDLKTIGFFASVRLPYTWKFLWSPIMDRYGIGRWGRRRGWMLLTQLGLLLTLLAFTQIDPTQQIGTLAVLALLCSFFSASQDIAIDAYRREILPPEELGLGSSLGVLGYRFGTMFASGGAFLMAGELGLTWPMIYGVMGVSMAVGLLTTLFCSEPQLEVPPPKTLRDSVIGPLQEFFSRSGAWTVLAFVFLYKCGESLASEMYNPFFIAMGFSDTEIGTVTKIFAVWATIGGGIVGGFLMVTLKTYRSLWIFGILQTLGLTLFAALATLGHSVPFLTLAVMTEYFTSGMATSAFVAFVSLQSNTRFTAVQYALLTSLGVGLPSILLGSFSGVLAEQLGWMNYFLVCSAITLPGLLILFKVKNYIHEGS